MGLPEQTAGDFDRDGFDDLVIGAPGDLVIGDRFASVLMPPRAFVDFPWTVLLP